MLTSINITPAGDYQVSGYLRDGRGYGRWLNLREFAYQGHARDFADIDCPKFTNNQIQDFARTYRPGKAYLRQGFKRYIPYAISTVQDVINTFFA